MPIPTTQAVEKIFRLDCRRRTLRLFCAAALFLALALPGKAETVTWQPVGGGALTTGTNWSSNPLLPGSGDDVVISTTENAILTSDVDLTYQSAVFDTTNYNHLNFINPNVKLTITDALSVTSGRLTFGTGTFHITNDDDTAVLSATGTSGAYLDFIAGQSPIVVADKLNLSTDVEPWIAEEGELTVRNGATITTSSAVTFGRTTGYTFKTNLTGGASSISSSNSIYIGRGGSGQLLVDGSSTTLSLAAASIQIGGGGADGNLFTIQNGAKVTTSSSTSLGAVADTQDNVMTVTGAGSEFAATAGNLSVGGRSINTQLTISGGGKVDYSAAGFVRIGTHADGGGNTVTVTGTGSQLLTQLTGAGNLVVGSASSGNKLLIENGGFVRASRVDAGYAGTTNNTLEVTTGGVLEAEDLVTGGDSANTITVHDGGVLQFAVSPASIAILPNGGAITLGNDGVLSFKDINDAPTAPLTNLTYAGTVRTYRLDNAQNASVGNYTFDENQSTYTQLELRNGGAWNSTGELIIGEGGALLGSGTINAETTVGTGGQLAIGQSPGTMVFENLTLSTGSTSDFEIDGFTIGLYDLALGGIAGGQFDVTFGGTLNLIFASGFNTAGTVQIFDFAGYSSTFDTINTTGLASGYTASFDQLTGIVTVVPEPATGLLALGGMGLVLLCSSRRRR